MRSLKNADGGKNSDCDQEWISGRRGGLMNVWGGIALLFSHKQRSQMCLRTALVFTVRPQRCEGNATSGKVSVSSKLLSHVKGIHYEVPFLVDRLFSYLAV